MNAAYDRFAKYYDLEYGHKENDLDFYLDLAEAHGGPVLEVGVGTGRVAFDLAAAGHEVWGIDNSAKMLHQARSGLREYDELIQQRLTLVQADMRDFNLDRRFPLCIAPFRTFLHNLTLSDQLSTLRSIRSHLQPGGTLALDLFVPIYSVMAQDEWRDRVEAHELADPQSELTIEIKVRHQQADQLLIIQNKYNYKNRPPETAEMKYRYVFRYEMETLLRLAGYNSIEVYGGFEKQPYDYHSGIMVFIAKAEA